VCKSPTFSLVSYLAPHVEFSLWVSDIVAEVVMGIKSRTHF